MSLKKKLLGNGVASAGSIGWSAIMQLISVPILSSTWGLEKYGVWLMVITIPTYFALSDLGFSTAATSDMTMAYAKGKRDSIVVTFQSVWVLSLLLGMSAVAITSPLAFLSIFDLTGSLRWWSDNGIVIFVMICYSAAVLCSRIVLSGFRSTGNYAVGTMTYDAIQFIEGLSVLTVAHLGGSFSECAAAYFIVRVLNIACSYMLLRRRVPWLHLGFRMAERGELRRLFKPAIASMAIPSSLAISIQGMVLVAGSVISPAAAAILGPVRTASRIAIQIVGIVNRATVPEFSAALAKGDRGSIIRLIKINAMSILVVLLPGAICFAFFGKQIMAIWSAGKIHPNSLFIALMAIAMFVHGIWYFSSNLLMAVNRHGAFAKMLMINSVVSLLLAVPAGIFFGLTGIALAIIAGEVVALGMVYITSRSLRLSSF